ncbi:DUF4153 domain-containing protein [Bradyrhizobium roseum]|uniref:DUF4153 domain-containing protein n=1 Tax=Bradyrhizobium roseum TaxID=3056648 RepID=UPI002619361A|nr:DUF4173 domain-containing protein [Bradyrhizobium roseus]WKA30700.1 DUF4173 domain-containing protein [Bradyrhizobium roseus]
MADLITPASDASTVQQSAMPIKPAIVIALAALADWLFYGESIGISAVIFSLALASGSLLVNFATFRNRQALPVGILLLLGLMPAIEELNFSSLLFIIMTFGICLQVAGNRPFETLGQRALALRDLYVFGPFRFLRDVPAMFDRSAAAATIAIWIVPLVLGCVFTFLFASANPLIEKWIRLVTPDDASSHLSLSRSLFWVAALSVAWPFIHIQWRSKPERSIDRTLVDMTALAGALMNSADARTQEPETAIRQAGFFGVAAILRSLVLFNLLFAVQTVLEIIYLWGNTELPPDISYATDAHRGAYPLIITALLAAGFVLAAMRPGGPAERSRVIRPLVYVWVAQNVLLVVSSILRLDLYVQTYLLTWWRIAAFVWMVLVVLGLLLIVARIALNRSNDWLIRANLLTLTATLYVCSLVNFAAIIADYNVSHSREANGKGVWIDLNYLFSLGPQALPAIDRAIVLRGFDPALVSRRGCLVEQQVKQMASWRAWGFRSWRLQRALGAQPKTTSAG